MSLSILCCLSLSFCVCSVAPKLRSLHFTHPVYVASRYFQQNPPFSLSRLRNQCCAGVTNVCLSRERERERERDGTGVVLKNPAPLMAREFYFNKKPQHHHYHHKPIKTETFIPVVSPRGILSKDQRFSPSKRHPTTHQVSSEPARKRERDSPYGTEFYLKNPTPLGAAKATFLLKRENEHLRVRQPFTELGLSLIHI